MERSNKEHWIYFSIIFGVILFFLIFYLIITSGGLSSEMKEKLDSYEDRLMICSSQVSSMIASNEILSYPKGGSI